MSSVTSGDALPGLVRTIDLADMVAYGGATWDWHRLHYDREVAASRRLPGPVVDGQVFGALLAEQVLDWLGPEWRLVELHFRLLAAVFAGETVSCSGWVKSATGDRIVVEQQIQVGERTVVGPAGAEAERL